MIASDAMSRPRLVVSRPGRTREAAEPPISNARLAMAAMLVAETMYFAGLIGAYLLFRVSSPAWPPPGLPHLPLGITWANTAVLVLSGITMTAALRAVRRDDGRRLIWWLGWTALLGATFVAVQGSEWVRLVHHGLTLSSGTYGGTFYLLIGSHAVHVIGAVAWVMAVALVARRGRFGADRVVPVEVCAIYWWYVCALWIALFGLVYG